MPDDHPLLPLSGRLESLDVFRGLTMILLIAGGFGLPALAGDPVFGFLGRQFIHHPWHGLRFEDLIQPFFMFIVGVAMPFSFGRRWERGETWGRTFRHVIQRSIILFLLGVTLHITFAGKYVWELWNVLTQLSVTYLVAFLFMRKSIRTQLIVSFTILLANYLLYRFFPVPGSINPWEKDHNFGSSMDMILMGKLNPGGGWVAINIIGSTAHTMWGVIAGLVLRSARPDGAKIRLLVAAGIAGVILGLALDPVTPIVKRICTSSFIIETGGISLLALALCFWALDVKGWKRWALIPVAVGMNPIFLYLTYELLGTWLRTTAAVFEKPFLDPSGIAGTILIANAVLAVQLYLAWRLWKRRIFFKI
jgi:predicted acyltransferase